MTKIGKHAVIIGSSLAGLLSARVLSEIFEQVTILERDSQPRDPGPRKGVPQGAHIHGLLAKGLNILESYFPGLTGELERNGGVLTDSCADSGWDHFGGWRARFPTDIRVMFFSRPFFETHVYKRINALPNIKTLHDVKVTELIFSDDRSEIKGVRYTNEKSDEKTDLLVDYVIDASGRNSLTPRWLEEAGYTKPRTQEVKVAIGYATRVFSRSKFTDRGKVVFVTPKLPVVRRMGSLFPIENNQWMCTLAGWLGDHPPRSEEGFLQFAKELAVPDIYNVMTEEKALTDIAVFKYPASTRRYFEELTTFPENFAVLGDVICSFNPVYGQGMTIAALESQLLGEVFSAAIAKNQSLKGANKIYLKQLKKIVDVPWGLSVAEDLRLPEVEGKRPPLHGLMSAYTEMVHYLARTDPVVTEAFYNVMHMLKPPTILFQPGIVARVIKAAVGKRENG